MTNRDVSAGLSARTDRAVSWVGWHLAELIGIGLPLVLAVTVAAWFALISAVVLAAWLAHEVPSWRRQQRVPRIVRPALPPGTEHNGESEGASGESA